MGVKVRDEGKLFTFKATAVAVAAGIGRRLHDALFGYMARTGLVLSVVEVHGDVVDDEVEGQGGEEAQEQQHTEQDSGETPGSGGAGAEGEAAGGAEDDGEIVVTIGDEKPEGEEQEPERAPAWVRDLRKANREKDRKLRELEAENARLKGGAGTTQPAEIVVGAKPTLAGCEFDEDKYEAELSAWHERKRQADDAVKERAKGEEQAKAAWQSKLQGFEQAKTALKVPDYADAEEVVLDTLSQMQQGVIVHGLNARDSALMVYALGKNPARAKKLAEIRDPVQFAIAVGELKKDLKVTPKKQAPAPDRQVRPSGAAGASAVAGELERLQKEADKTGDRSKVAAYLRQKARAAA